jgi:hypothetical protein
MVDLEMVQVVSSTGALMAHGLIEGVGLRHYKHNPAHPDSFLAEHKPTASPIIYRGKLQSHRGNRRQGPKVLRGQRTHGPSMFHDAVASTSQRTFPTIVEF